MKCGNASLRIAWLCAAVLSLSLAGPVSAQTAPAAGPLSPSALYASVVTYADLGLRNHLTYSSSEQRTLDWMAHQFRTDRMTTGSNPYSYLAFYPHRVALSVAGRNFLNITPYFYSGTTGARPRVAPLAYAGLGTPAEVAAAGVRGKIAVIWVPYVDDGLDPTLPGAFSAIEQAGAVGLIAVTQGPGNYAVNQDVNSRAGLQKLPTVFIGQISGARVIAAARHSRLASLLLDAQTAWSCASNDYGVLPGPPGSQLLIVGTPTSSWDEAAAERGSGVAILLALARFYAGLPVAQRPATLIFVALSGHEIGYLGLPMFMEAHPAWFAQAAAYFHLGASLGAVQQAGGPRGSLVRLPVGDVTRAIYASENPVLQPVVQQAFLPSQPVGSVPPGVSDVGEQAYAYHAGVPIVAVSGASYYFHTSNDTPAGVSPRLLVQMATAFRNAINGVADLPAGLVRSANAVAAQLGARQNPNPSPGLLPSGSAAAPDPPHPGC